MRSITSSCVGRTTDSQRERSTEAKDREEVDTEEVTETSAGEEMFGSDTDTALVRT
jgi:hypothetical protein